MIDAADMELVRLCTDSVRSHKVASALLSGGKAEQEIEWTDPETRIECRGRVDYISGRVDYYDSIKLRNQPIACRSVIL